LKNCIFCDIITRKVEAVIVYEDEDLIAFMDYEPFNLGHLLVVTKKHYKYITEMQDDDVGYLFKVVSYLSKVISIANNVDGLNIGQSNGLSASQQIFHVHVHVIPRYIGDSKKNMFPSRKNISQEQLINSAKKILKILNSKKSK
jgi:histidine triad (HIT) family protein